MQLKKPKAVIFDWDNTIVDARNILLTALDMTLEKYGKSPPKLYLSGKSREIFFKELFGDNWEEVNELFKFNLTIESFDKLIFFPDIIPLLENLKKNNIFTAIVSNKEGNLLRKEVQYFNLTGYFDEIIGSGDTPEDKPSPKPIFKALEHSKIPITKDNIYFIGDSLVDLQCAENAGITGILYNLYSNNLHNAIKTNSHRHLMEMLGY